MTEGNLASEYHRLAEPLCWGAPGLALLPAEWSRLAHHRRQVGTKKPITKAEKSSYRKGQGIAELDFFSPIAWAETLTEESVLELAVVVADSLRSLTTEWGFPDQPVITSSWISDASIEEIPYLKSTAQIISGLEHSVTRTTLLLEMSVSEVWDLFGSTRALLDVVQTSRSWVDRSLETLRSPELDRGEGQIGLDDGTNAFSRRTAQPASWHEYLLVVQRRSTEMALPYGSQPERDRKILWARMGTSSLDLRAKTLEEAGSESGLTRERVRQVEARMMPHPAETRDWGIPDLLRQALGHLRDPTKRDGLDPMFEIAREMDLEVEEAKSSVAKFLELSGQEIDSELSALLGVNSSGSTTKRKANLRILVDASKEINNRIHVVPQDALVKKLVERGVVADEVEAQRFVLENATVIDLPGGYIYNRGAKDTLVETTSQCLAVCRPLRLADLHAAFVRRSGGRADGVVPSREILTKILAALPEFEVTEGWVDAVEGTAGPADDSIILRLVVFIQQCDGGVAHLLNLTKLALQAGIKPSTVTQFVQFHPLLVKLPDSLVTTVGNHPTPSDLRVAMLNGSSLTQKLRASVHYLPEGWLLEIHPNLKFLTSPQLNVPSTIADYLSNATPPLVVNGERRGTLRAWGGLMQLSPSGLQDLGVTNDSVIVIRIDRRTNTAALQCFAGSDWEPSSIETVVPIAVDDEVLEPISISEQLGEFDLGDRL